MTALTENGGIQVAARAGYATRGVVYLIIAFFTFLATIGNGGKTDTKGALQTLMEQSFGAILLGLVVFGLFGYAVWRFLQAIADADNHGTDAKGLVIRAALLVSAFTYLALSLYALSLLGLWSSSGSEGKSSMISVAVNAVGPTIVALALGLVFAGVAFAHFRKAWLKKFNDHIDAPDEYQPLIDSVSIIGLASRGLIFVVFAIILFTRLPKFGEGDVNVPDLKSALNFVQSLPMGWLLLALLAVGIALFALYSLVEARWRRVSI